MADDQDDSQKTEEPTQKKLEDARRKGQVAKSQEIGHWFMTAGITLAVLTFAVGAGDRVVVNILPFIEAPHSIAVDEGHLLDVFRDLGSEIAIALAPVLGILMLAGLAGNLIQHRPVVSAEKLKPKLDKISIVQGVKRQFSSRALVDFIKGILKLVVVAAVAIALVWPELGQLQMLMTYDIRSLLPLVEELSLLMLGGVAAVMGVIGGADFMYQKYMHQKELRMSKQDIKEEFKDAEGDPHIKARLRAIRAERSRQRMMQAVPEANVVVTNPTHFAVAMKYDGASMAAPVVVAKGQDNIALKIREIATENGVPIVENPPLARALHKAVEIDDEIPVEYYKAVAEIISYVMKLKK